jgi:hypothetical protein
MNEEGWYIDPFGRHEARWMSEGTPTSLVRDGTAESQDPPPPTVIDGELEPVPEAAPPSGGDLRRVDEAQSQVFDPGAMRDAAEEAIDSATGL